MNFKRIFTIVSLGIIGIFSAQKIDSKAKNILDETAKNYKSKNTIYLKFTYGTGKNNKITKQETGIFYSAKNKYKLKIMGNEQIFDGKKIYNINSEDMEVTIASPNGNETTLSPINYLDTYKSGYNIIYGGNKNGIDYVKLTPTKSNGIKQVNLYINSSKKQIVKVEQLTSTNDLTSINISQYKENLSINPTTFVFNKNLYKNYLITEL